MEISKKQSDIIQLMRGVAVIMVVLQHSIARIATSNWQFKIIYFLNHIDVAIFFVISGYLFEFKKEKYYQESKMVYIKNKIKALLFPYLFWSLILAVGIKIANIFMPNLQNIIGIKAWTWKDIIINTLFFKDYNVQHLWFIYVLFFFFLLNRLFKDSLINGKVFVFIMPDLIRISPPCYSTTRLQHSASMPLRISGFIILDGKKKKTPHSGANTA